MTNKLSIEEIAKVFNVPVHMITNVVVYSTYIEKVEKDFVNTVLNLWLRKIKDVL